MRIALFLIIILIILAILLYVPITELYKYLQRKNEIRALQQQLVTNFQRKQISKIKVDTEINKLKQEIEYRKELMPRNEEIKKLENELSKLNDIRGDM